VFKLITFKESAKLIYSADSTAVKCRLVGRRHPAVSKSVCDNGGFVLIDQADCFAIILYNKFIRTPSGLHWEWPRHLFQSVFRSGYRLIFMFPSGPVLCWTEQELLILGQLYI